MPLVSECSLADDTSQLVLLSEEGIASLTVLRALSCGRVPAEAEDQLQHVWWKLNTDL
jgi:hypothetical protein